MAVFLHGVETIETVSGPVPVIETASSIVAIVGTAELAAPNQLYVTRTLDEAKALYGDGSILSALKRMHTYYSPSITVVGLPLGKDSDFTAPVFKTIKGEKQGLELEQVNSKAADPLLAAFIEHVPLFLKARTLFGFNPKIGLAPGIMHKAGASGAVLPIARKLRMVWFADLPEDVATPEDARLAKELMGDERIMCAWPRPKVVSDDGDTIIDWAAPSWAGLMVQVDKNLAAINGGSGYWCSPSNLPLGDVVGVEHPLSFVINDPDSEANYLNANGISTIINYGGLIAWGNRSSAYPDNSDPMTFLCWRRTADVIEESIEFFTMQFLDRPMFTRPEKVAATLLGQIQDSVNDFLRSKVGTAIIDGKCWIESVDNPLINLSQGMVRIRYRFTPPMCTEHVVFDSEIYVQGLEDAFKKLFGG